jgi:hypothetical protein
MSFLMDPPLLAASGAAIERAVPDAGRAAALEAGTTAAFIGVSLGLYANAPGLSFLWRRFGSRSGREFMLGSGLVEVRDRRMRPAQHLGALSLFLLYPLWIRLGRLATRRR